MKTYLALKIYSLLKSGTQTLIGDTPAWLGRQQNRWREKYRSPRVDREIALVQFKNIFATVCPTHQLETRTCATLDWRGLYEVAYVLSFGQKIRMNTLKIFTSQESARPGGLVFLRPGLSNCFCTVVWARTRPTWDSGNKSNRCVQFPENKLWARHGNGDMQVPPHYCFLCAIRPLHCRSVFLLSLWCFASNHQTSVSSKD